MHTVEKLSLNCGLKIDKPYLHQQYFPCSDKKKVVISAQTGKDSNKNYKYWNEIIRLIKPKLTEAGFELVQIGTQEDGRLEVDVDLRSKINYNHLAYIINKSDLVLGTSEIAASIASSFGKKVVSIHAIPSFYTGPFWGEKENKIVIDCDFNGNKAFFEKDQNNVYINKIKPEKIAQAVFQSLDINESIQEDAVYIGPRFGAETIASFVPTNVYQSSPNGALEIRMDLEFNQEVLFNQLRESNCVIVTDKAVDINVLKLYKNRVASLFYEVTENDDPDFVKSVKSLGIQVALFSKEDMSHKKIHYYEIGNINLVQNRENDLKELKADSAKDIFYKSNRIYKKGDSLFYTLEDLKRNSPCNLNEFKKLEFDPCLLREDVDFLYVVKKSA